MKYRWIRAGLLFTAFVFPGCGDKLPPPPKLDLVPVTGTVKLGGQATAGIRVTFVPYEQETKGSGGTGTTDAAGKYELFYNSNADQKHGIPAGKYGVLFSKSPPPVANPGRPGIVGSAGSADGDLVPAE